jgi:hypothetical protein
LGEPTARFILLAAYMPSAGIHFGPVLSGLLIAAEQHSALAQAFGIGSGLP